MSSNSPAGSDSTRSLTRWIALAAFLPSLAFAATAKPPERVPRRNDPCSATSLASGIEAQSRCAQRVATASCANNDDAAVATALSKKLRLDQAELMRGLRRLNVPGAAPRHWCNLKTAELRAIVRAAAESDNEFAESREEYQRFTMGDENGYIPPDGLARALKQRQALVHAPGDTVHAQFVARSALAGLPASVSGWTNLTGYVHPVGRVNDLLIHPTSTNTMWAGTDGGGIWKTTDSGTTWQQINDFLGSLSISSFAMRPGDPSTIYAATGAIGSHTGAGGDGIFKSTDTGATFSQLAATDPTTNPDFQYVYDLAIHPTDSNTVLAATYGGAYITTNGGTIWTKITTGTTRAWNVAIHGSNGNLRVIAMDDGTVRVATDGVTYYSYTIATVSSPCNTRIALAPSNQSVMYALIRNIGAAASQFYRSPDGGATWTQVTVPTSILKNQLFYTGGIWVDPTNANHVAVSEYWAGITSDASLPSPTWSNSGFGWVDFHGIVNDPGYNGSSNKKVYFFDDGGLYCWTDVDTINTTSPAYLSVNGINATEAYTTAGRGGNTIFGAQDVGARLFMTATGDPTQKWRFTSFPYSFTRLFGDGATTAADRTNPSTLYGSLQYLTLQRSLDGGSTSQIICQGITDILCNPTSSPAQLEGGNAAFIAPFVLDPNNQSTMIAGAASLWRSNDVSSGTPPTWTAIHSGNTSSRVSAIAVAPSDSNTIWVAYQNGNVYKTTNGLNATPTWGQVTTVPVGSKLRIYIDRTNSSHVWIGLSGFVANRLVVTPDGGTTWSNVAGLPAASVFAIQQHPANASWLYVGTAVGLFASPDGGTTWSASNEGPANVQVRDLQWYSDTPAVLLLGTFGRGIWRATISSTPPPAAPSGLQATATSTTNVQLTWNAVSGATGYKILRASVYPSFSQIGTSSTPSYTDTTALASTAYLYAVRASDGISDSANSTADLATTIIYTDPAPVVGVTMVRAVHLNEVRTAVTRLNVLAGLVAPVFTDPVLTSSTTVKAAHFLELRTAINQARAAVGLIDYLFGETFGETLIPDVTLIKAYHINELRLAMK